MNEACKMHLVDMLDGVHHMVKNHSEFKNKIVQISEHINRGFSKKLYFNPGIYFDDQGRQQFYQDVSIEPLTSSALPMPSTSGTARQRQRGDSAISSN